MKERQKGKGHYLKAVSLLATAGASVSFGDLVTQANTWELTDREPEEQVLETETAPFETQTIEVVEAEIAQDTNIAIESPELTYSPVEEVETSAIINAQEPAQSANQAGEITISGEPQVGQTLTATVTDPDGLGASQVSYQWSANATAIPGATEQTYMVTEGDVGRQINVSATYQDGLGQTSRVSGDYLAAVAGAPSEISPLTPSASLPIVSLEGDSQVREGETATYTVRLSQATSQPITVDLNIIHQETSVEDVNARRTNQQIRFAPGETARRFRLETRADNLVEGVETYRIEIAHALAESEDSRQPNQDLTVTRQSVIIPAYNYPEAKGRDAYWDRVQEAGGGNIPFAIINPRSGAGQRPDDAYIQLLQNNIAAGIENIGYISTVYGSRSIKDVKDEVLKYFEFYGESNIHGFFFDETGIRTNQQILYMAEIYNYVKSLAPDKLIIANPGAAIPDRLAPYADIFVTSEVSADTYIRNFQQPTSLFENTASNARHIMHIVHSASPEQYSEIIDLSRGRNAGWLFITSDSDGGDNNPYNDLPANFNQMVTQINNLGGMEAPQGQVETLPQAAGLGQATLVTSLIDANGASDLPLEGENPGPATDLPPSDPSLDQAGPLEPLPNEGASGGLVPETPGQNEIGQALPTTSEDRGPLGLDEGLVTDPGVVTPTGDDAPPVEPRPDLVAGNQGPSLPQVDRGDGTSAATVQEQEPATSDEAPVPNPAASTPFTTSLPVRVTGGQSVPADLDGSPIRASLPVQLDDSVGVGPSLTSSSPVISSQASLPFADSQGFVQEASHLSSSPTLKAEALPQTGTKHLSFLSLSGLVSLLFAGRFLKHRPRKP